MQSTVRVPAIRLSLLSLAAVLALQSAASSVTAAHSEIYDIGLAKVDITPEGPIRLSGFYHRQTESVGVRERIFARAMAIRGGSDVPPVVLVTVDSIGVPMAVRDE